MLTIQFPEYECQLRNNEQGNKEIFDGIRKKWLLVTPEEWVRQNIIQWLIEQLKVPPAFIAVEKAITVSGRKRRFDIVVFNRQHQPWLLIECKAPEVQLSERVLQQALSYLSSVPAACMMISNGQVHAAWKREHNTLQQVDELPPFDA